MAEPTDAIKAIHNAFRNDMALIDIIAKESARGNDGFSLTADRYRFFGEILLFHAHGEEKAVFPALEAVAPCVAEAYERDHRGLDTAYDTMNAAVAANDRLATARATAAFKFHLDIHLAKEDAHLYRLFRERLSMPDQGKIVGIMANEIPPDRQPDFIMWLFPLIDQQDRENMVRIQQMVIPPPVFVQVKQLIQRAISVEGWEELTRRVPALVQN
jgi:hypothetical protein